MLWPEQTRQPEESQSAREPHQQGKQMPAKAFFLPFHKPLSQLFLSVRLSRLQSEFQRPRAISQSADRFGLAGGDF